MIVPRSSADAAACFSIDYFRDADPRRPPAGESRLNRRPCRRASRAMDEVCSSLQRAHALDFSCAPACHPNPARAGNFERAERQRPHGSASRSRQAAATPSPIRFPKEADVRRARSCGSPHPGPLTRRTRQAASSLHGPILRRVSDRGSARRSSPVQPRSYSRRVSACRRKDARCRRAPSERDPAIRTDQ